MKKEMLYKTAKAVIACAEIRTGEYVSVRYSHKHNGVAWYNIDRTERGELPYTIVYPSHHLIDFCL